MGSTRMASVMHLLRQLVSRHPPTAVSDAQLLHRYAELDDETAFAALLHRHGPMVFGLCRRLLGNETDADDVFQATFLVLIRRAGSIRRRRSVGSWLHGVALRLARRVRSDAVRRQRLELERPLPLTSSTPDADVRPIIDEELEKLHEKYRAPLVLCYLEGKTYDEAASQLGVSLTTVCGRLARARNLLRTRLTRRGLAPAISTTALGLSSQQLLAVVPPTLAATTARLATLLATAEVTTTVGVSASVTALVEGIMKAVFVSKLKVAAAILLAATVIGAGAGVLARQAIVKPEAGRTAVPDDRDEAVQKELKKLEGVWVLKEQAKNGKETPKEHLKTLPWVEMTIKGSSMKIASMDCPIVIDPSKKPKTIDRIFKQPDGPDIKSEGIYELDGDILKICWDTGRKPGRPKELKPAEGVILSVHERKKK